MDSRRPAPFGHYIGLGDSISIDDYPGPGMGAISLLYRNHEAHPDFTGRDLLSLSPGMQFLSLAFDAATTTDVLHWQMPRLPPDTRECTLVTLTAGGNDLLERLSRYGALAEEEAWDVGWRLEQVLDEVQGRYRDCLVVLGTIYDPTDGVGDLLVPGEPLTQALQVLNSTNEAILKLGEREGVRVADIHRHFLGHGSHCQEPSNPHYHADDPSHWFVLDIEPNARGASEVRRCFWEALPEA